MREDPIAVLSVDDPPDVESVVEGLESASERLSVTSASSVDEAVSALGSAGYDCVVTSHSLEDGTGLELVEAVRERDADLPVILLAEDGGERLASDAITAGVTDYVERGRREDEWAWLATRIETVVDEAASARTGHLDAMLEDLPGLVYRCLNEPAWPMERVEGRCEALTGYPAAALESGEVNWGEDLVHPDERDELWESVQRALEAGEAFEVTYRIETKDGETRWMWERGEGVYDGDGEVVALQGYITDVTSLREREWAIERLHDVAQEFMEAESKVAVAEIAVEGARDVLGLPVNTVWLYDEAADALVPEAWTDRAEAVIGDLPTFERGEGLAWTAFESGEVIVANDVMERPDRYNEDSPIRSEIVFPLGEHGVLIAGSPRPSEFDEEDVALTEFLAANAEAALARAERERALTETTERLELALEGANLGVYDWYVQSDEITFDERVAEMLGFTLEEWEGDLDSWRERAHPDDLASIQAELERFFEEDGSFSESEYRIQRKDGEWIWIRSMGRIAEYDENGDPYRVVGVHQDITDQKERERELERQNERLNEFASIVSHDLRNPLNVAVARVASLEDELDDRRLEQVASALERMTDLIEDVLSLTRGGQEVVDPEPTKLAAAATQAWATAGSPEAHLDFEGDLGRIHADGGRLRQLLENLFRNAREHVGADVTVRIGRLESGFYVEDDGPGIPPDQREEVFDSGFTTGEGGTGFGLAIVQEIANAHGWDVSVAEGRDGGARFEVQGVRGAE